jgi:hypothetical protein
MARNMQIFHQPRKQATRKQYKIQQQNEEKRRKPILREKKFSPTMSKPLLFSFQLIETGINTMRSLAAKRIENA